MELSELTAKRPILFVIGSAEIGGAELQLVRLAQELTSRNILVEVVFTQAGGPLTSQLDKSAIKWRVFPIRIRENQLLSFLSLLRFCKYLVTRRPLLINTWLPESTGITFSLARVISRGTPLVASLRGNPISNGGIFEFLYRKVLRSADHVIANAQHLVEIAISQYKIPLQKLEVIPNGVNTPAIHAIVSKQPATAVVIANFHQYKGHAILLEALTKVNAPLKVRLCGTGEELSNIQNLIQEKSLSSVVTVVGPPADIAWELSQAQFAIHPSSTEGMSNAILEELTSGLPVIAFDIKGNIPIIDHGKNGMLVKHLDVDEFAKAIQSLATDVALRERLSTGALSPVNDYSWEANANRYASTFASLIKNTKD